MKTKHKFNTPGISELLSKYHLKAINTQKQSFRKGAVYELFDIITKHFLTKNMNCMTFLIRRSSTLVREKIHNWTRVPHYNVLCIGNSAHGKTRLAHELSGLSFEDLSRQSGSFNQPEEEDRRKSTKSTCFVEYEFDQLHFAHLDTPGEFYSNNLVAAYSAFDIVIWVINKNIGLETTDHVKLAKKICPEEFEKRTCVYIDDQDLEDSELGDLLQEEIDGAVKELQIPSCNVTLQSSGNLKSVLSNIVSSVQTTAWYRNDPLTHLPIERSFPVTGVGQIAVGILKGNKNSTWKPKMSLELVGENNILPVEMIQTGMFYKTLKQSEVGDRVNSLIKSNVKKFGKLVNRGGVLVPEGYGQKYHKDEFSFEPEIDLSKNYRRAAAHTWDVSIKEIGKNCVKLDKKYFIRPGDKVTFFAKDPNNRGFETVRVT